MWTATKFPAKSWRFRAGLVSRASEAEYRVRGGSLATAARAVESDDLPALHTLVAGLRRDHAAVTAGLTLPYSSGAVEGQVHRIKALKRAMFGRANLDLLLQRILIPH